MIPRSQPAPVACFFVLDALLSVVNLCELEFAVHLAAGDRPGLLSCGLWQQLYYSKQGPALLRLGGEGTF